MEGSSQIKAGPVTVGCISPEARDLLDGIMDEWREHWKNLPADHRPRNPDDVNGFAYWLVRWSGLIQPNTRGATPVESEGAKLISAERARQIRKEHYSAEHDDELHARGDLAMAAVCYAMPEKLLCRRNFANAVAFRDPWPWDPRHDKRAGYGEGNGNVLPDPDTYTDEERLDLLVKAGALIAAEVDRLLRAGENRKEGEE